MIKLAVVVAVPVALALAASAGLAADPADVVKQRQESLEGTLHRDTAYSVAGHRNLCASGKMPAFVAEERAGGALFYPDAVDFCVAVLMRTARDGHLSELYVKLLGEMGGDVSQAQGLPDAIGGAALANQKAAPIGKGNGMVITPGLAFDAGFTAAENDAGAKAPGTANAAQLRALAAACLAQQQSSGPCFSAGYMYGAQAVRGQISFAH